MDGEYISIPKKLFEEMVGFVSDVLPGCGPNRMKDAERILIAVNSVKSAQNRPDATGLKPCPFCGKEAYMEVRGEKEGEEVIFKVGCKVCDANAGDFDNPDDAIFAWNKRVL